MAKVKIQGHASGTGILTVTAPNTSTDRTITLPDATGTLTFTPSITDGGNATAMTIDSAENVGIGVTPESWEANWTALQIGDGSAISSRTDADNLELSTNAYYDSANTRWEYIGNNSAGTATQYYQQSGTHVFRVAPSGSADAAITWSTAMTITNDGRGVSSFTAKAWVNFNGTGTIAIRNSHNVSSITDQGAGDYYYTLSNALTDTHPTIINGFNERDCHCATDYASNTTTQIHLEACNVNGTRGDKAYVVSLCFR